MKAVRINEYGGPEVLNVEEVPMPQCKAGQVVLRVEAAGVNFVDTCHRRGLYPWGAPPPVTLGREAAGEIEEIGEGVTGFSVGDRVAALANGAYAEYMRVPAPMIISIPRDIDFVTAAAFHVQALTAYHLTHTSHAVGEDETVLVHAAAGGVGLMLVQMAKMRGASVFGTISSDDKAKLLSELDIDATINYTESSFDEEVNRLTNGEGVDVIYDAVGKAALEGNLNALRPFGHLVSYGAASGAPEAIDSRSLSAKSLKLSGFLLDAAAHLPSIWQHGITQVVDWLKAGKLKPTVHRVLLLEEAAEAHRLLESRGSVGKIVLRVAEATQG